MKYFSPTRIIFSAYLLIQLFSINLLIGQNYLFSIGPVYSPFKYQSYNKSDWNNYPNSHPAESDRLNGHGIGFRIQIPIASKFSIESGLNYNIQDQKHKTTSNGGNLLNDEGIFNIDIATTFKMICIPVRISYNQEIGYKSGFYLKTIAGPQISFLTSYESTFSQYEIDYSQNGFFKDSLVNYIIRIPGKSYQKVLFHPDYEEFYFDTPYLYTKILFGISGSIELQKYIGNNVLVGLGFFSDYDFTNSENFPTWQYAYPLLGGFKDGKRSKSHNFRIGLTLTAQYVFY